MRTTYSISVLFPLLPDERKNILFNFAEELVSFIVTKFINVDFEAVVIGAINSVSRLPYYWL
jgi:hypothetical protein